MQMLYIQEIRRRFLIGFLFLNDNNNNALSESQVNALKCNPFTSLFIVTNGSRKVAAAVIKDTRVMVNDPQNGIGIANSYFSRVCWFHFTIILLGKT